MDFGSPGFSSNPYFDQQVQDSLGDTVKAWNMVQQPAYNAAMVRSGSFGNSGIEQMNDFGLQQFQHGLGRQANDMRSGNFWQGMGFDAQNYFNNQNLDRAIYNDSWQQNQQNFQNGLGLIGMMQGANTQSLGLGTQVQNTPLDYWGTFSNAANGIGQGFATGKTTTSASGSPLMGALAGYQFGSMFKPTSSETGNYGFIGQGTPDTSGWSNGNGGWTSNTGTTYNNPSAYVYG